jgi:hypothetical protein
MTQESHTRVLADIDRLDGTATLEELNLLADRLLTADLEVRARGNRRSEAYLEAYGRAQWLKMHATHCFGCGKEFGAGDVICHGSPRQRPLVGEHGGGRWILPYCADCIPPGAHVEACEHCGRPTTGYIPDRFVCSERCRRALRYTPVAPRAHTCESCGESFAGRADAHYCTDACRQRAHRAKVAAARA